MTEGPLLDKIETSCTDYNTEKALCQKDSLKDECIENYEKYKHLQERFITARDIYNASVPLGSVYDSSIISHLDKMEHCGSWLAFQNDELTGANFCRERFCPLCQWRRSRRLYSRYHGICDHLKGDYAFLFLTLTVPNCKAADLKQTLNNMQKSSSVLFGLPSVARAFKGVARFTEVTYNKITDTFHPHFHCLVAVNRSYFTSRDYIRHEVIATLWTNVFDSCTLGRAIRKSSEDEFRKTPCTAYQVNIKRCNENFLAEITKYCVKPLELNIPPVILVDVLGALNAAIKGRRMIQHYGIFKGFAADDEEEENELTADSCSGRSFVYIPAAHRYIERCLNE